MKKFDSFNRCCIVFLITITCASCGKGHHTNSPVTPPPIIPPGSPAVATVYVAGTVGSGNSTAAVYWKNDTMVILPGALTSCQDIVVSGNDVYVAGNVNDTDGYWKNSSFIPLFKVTQAGYATSIAVSGNDVYVSGNSYSKGNSVAEYWKNGLEIKLTPDTINSIATAIAVSGGDVYLAGSVGNVAVYWKNGLKISLTDGTRIAYANAITINGTDIYVAGGEVDSSGTHGIAMYWQNGIPHSVSNVNNSAFLFAIGISGNHVYVAGDEKPGVIISTDNTAATYWNNDIETSLTNTSYGVAQSIAVDSSDVYVTYTGDVSNLHTLATYTKNGVKKILSDGTTANAYAIFVKK